MTHSLDVVRRCLGALAVGNGEGVLTACTPMWRGASTRTL